ncbi:MAG: outer membrane beta-barrel protein [Thioploca sp.]|nr:outer membrane beta-barrel protein [Thioploca sp.]
MKSPIKLTLMLSLVCSTALAEDTTPGIALGPARVFPGFELTLKQDSNILQQHDDEISSFITLWKPQIKLEGKKPSYLYDLTWETEIGRYMSSAADNYEDILLSAETLWQLTRRAELGLQGQYLKEHDDRGTTDRVDIGAPYQWHSSHLEGRFNYGRPSAKARIETQISKTLKRYDEFSLGDIDQTDIIARVIYRTSPKIRLLLETNHSLIDYQALNSTQDNQVNQYSIGATWYATSKTTGKAKVGYFTKNFTAAEREDFAGISWELGMRWTPVTRTTIDMTTRRYASDTTGIGDYLLNQDVSLAWTQLWKPRLSTTIGFTLAKQEFGGQIGLVPRADDVSELNLSTSYDWRKWLTLKLGLNFVQRDSNLDENDFNRIFWLISLKAAF